MPKAQALKKASDLQDRRAGLPDVPALYGLKARKNYLPFSHAQQRLQDSRNYWICSARPDGRPHSIPVWGFWMDGAVYFGTARSSRKARNLARNGSVSIHLESGDDVATEIDLTDETILKKLDAASREKYKMPLMTVPGESVFYCVRPRIVLAWMEKDFPNTATRWTFDSGME